MQLIVVPTIHIFSDLVRHFVMRSSARCFPVNRQEFQEFQEIYSTNWTLRTFISGPKVPKNQYFPSKMAAQVQWFGLKPILINSISGYYISNDFSMNSNKFSSLHGPSFWAQKWQKKEF